MKLHHGERGRRRSGATSHAIEGRKYLKVISLFLRISRFIGPDPDKMSIKSIVLLLFLTTAVLAAPQRPSRVPRDCPKRQIRMDKCTTKALLITDPDVKIYTTTNQLLEGYCGPVKEWQKCITDYRVCLKSFPRQVFSMVLSNSKKNTKSICNTEENRKGEFFLSSRQFTYNGPRLQSTSRI